MKSSSQAESPTEARMPMRPKPAMAAKAKPQSRMPASQQDLMSMAPHVPHVAASHMATKGKSVDGLAKWAQMQDESRMPVREANTMAPAGSATGSGGKGMKGKMPRMGM